MRNFQSTYAPGDAVMLGDDIRGHVIAVKFTYGRAIPEYEVEWFHEGQTQSGDFFDFQIEPAR